MTQTNNKYVEIWKPVEGYEDRYEVSNYGRVKSLSYLRNGKNCQYRTKEFIRTLTPNQDGYLTVSFHKDYLKKTVLVNRLVAKHFIKGDHSLTVNHIDRDRTNNMVHNLEWMEHGDNVRHSAKTGSYSRSKIGEKNGRSILTSKDVTEIKKLLSKGLQQKDIAEKFNVTPANISRIHRGLIWRSHE